MAENNAGKNELLDRVQQIMDLSRRTFAIAMTAVSGRLVLGNHRPSVKLADRIEGVLTGSLIGDALGGPLEFADEMKRRGRVAGCRDWDDQRRLTAGEIAKLADQLTMMDYREVRPDTAPYGQWIAKAPAGTMTDDSRLKVILIRALKSDERRLKQSESRGDFRSSEPPNLSARFATRASLAQQIVDFQPRIDRKPDQATTRLMNEGLAEYRMAARWILGERDETKALPIDRLWAGVANCSGQMMLTPMAALYPGEPEAAYRHSFEANFVDAPGAKDMLSAIVAGLAGAINDTSSLPQRWRNLETTMRTVDPYRFADVPFVGRPLIDWLDLADSIVHRAEGSPKRAYHLLETEGKPVYYWDAHFTLLVTWVLLKLTDFAPLASMNLAIDFGHDTDSYLQLMGALVGAAYGVNVFPQVMRNNVLRQLEAEYGETMNDWVEMLIRCRRNVH